MNACQIKNTQPIKFILIAFCREIIALQDVKEQKKIFEKKWGGQLGVNVLHGIPKMPHSLNACQIKNTQPIKFILIAFCREIIALQDMKEQKKIFEKKWGGQLGVNVLHA